MTKTELQQLPKVTLLQRGELVELVKHNMAAVLPHVLSVFTDDGKAGYVIAVTARSGSETWVLRIKHEKKVRVMHSMNVVTKILFACGFKEAQISLVDTPLIDIAY